MNAEPKQDEPKKKSFSLGSNVARDLRIRTGIRAGDGGRHIDNNGQPQRDGVDG
jgi:hypothetical protein